MPHPLVSFLPALFAAEQTLRAVACQLPSPGVAEGVLRLIKRVCGPAPAALRRPAVRRPRPPKVTPPPQEKPAEIPHYSDDPLGEALAEASSVRALALELIRHAATDWVRYRESPHKVRRSWADEAEIWLFEEDKYPECEMLRKMDGRELTSFVSLCRELDLDPEIVRRHIRQIPVQTLKSHHARKLSRPSGVASKPSALEGGGLPAAPLFPAPTELLPAAAGF